MAIAGSAWFETRSASAVCDRSDVCDQSPDAFEARVRAGGAMLANQLVEIRFGTDVRAEAATGKGETVHFTLGDHHGRTA